MALKKQIQYNNLDAQYWRIVGFNISLTGEMVQIFMVGYENEEMRHQKKNIISKNYMINQDKYGKYITGNNISVDSLYSYLKSEEPDFKGATDI